LAEIVRCARAHWKVENENNNVLKPKGIIWNTILVTGSNIFP